MEQLEFKGNPWFVRPNPRWDADHRLFCFSHAGGAASAYHGWQAALDEVEIWAIQSPGRESRLREPPITNLNTLVQHICNAISNHLDKPFFFFGHSMGSLVSYETARELHRRGLPLPAHLYVSGRPAPHLPLDEPSIHDLPEPEFLAELKLRYNGLPEEILADQDLLSFFLPILRSDFKTLETHNFLEEPKLPVTITAYCGDEDRIMNSTKLGGWEQLTTRTFSSHIFPGGHFYLHDKQDVFLDFFGDNLESHVAHLR